MTSPGIDIRAKQLFSSDPYNEMSLKDMGILTDSDYRVQLLGDLMYSVSNETYDFIDFIESAVLRESEND